MAGEVSAPEARVSPVVAGRFGLLPGAVATPLALVLTELLQNALQHGLVTSPDPAPAGSVLVEAARGPGQLKVCVEDNGAGLPEGFSLDAHASLGLQIVRTLVESELGGQLAITPRPGVNPLAGQQRAGCAQPTRTRSSLSISWINRKRLSPWFWLFAVSDGSHLGDNRVHSERGRPDACDLGRSPSLVAPKCHEIYP